MTGEDFFQDDPEALAIYRAIAAEVAVLHGVTERVMKSQVGFARARLFAAVWSPRRVLGRGAPLVLSVFLTRPEPSPRWKQVVEPAPGHFTHHLEIDHPDEVDETVASWLQAAWQEAG